jgi:hypothetical protein
MKIAVPNAVSIKSAVCRKRAETPICDKTRALYWPFLRLRAGNVNARHIPSLLRVGAIGYRRRRRAGSGTAISIAVPSYLERASAQLDYRDRSTSNEEDNRGSYLRRLFLSDACVLQCNT